MNRIRFIFEAISFPQVGLSGEFPTEHTATADMASGADLRTSRRILRKKFTA